MVAIPDWQAFVVEVKNMFVHRPRTTRCTMKYKRQTGELSVKVTDNTRCLKYRACTTSEVKNVERFGRMFIQWTLTKNASRLEDLSYESTSNLKDDAVAGTGPRRCVDAIDAVEEARIPSFT